MLDKNFCPSSLHPTITVQLHFLTSTVTKEAFIDSGAADNFVSASLVKKFTWTTEPLPQTLEGLVIDGTILASGPIRSCTTPIEMLGGVLQHESISFLVLSQASSQLVLGLPWLQWHSPVIDWSGSFLSSWVPTYHTKCLAKVVSVKSLLVASAEVSTLVPMHYSDFLDIFSKHKADQLPP